MNFITSANRSFTNGGDNRITVIRDLARPQGWWGDMRIDPGLSNPQDPISPTKSVKNQRTHKYTNTEREREKERERERERVSE